MRMVKGRSGAMAVTMVLRARVARSASRLWKLWTGAPSAVRPVALLARAAGERCALATGLSRSGFGGGLVVVVVEHRGEARAHVPFDVVGEHAQEHVGADAILQPMMDRADVQIDRLQAAKRAFDLAEGFVGLDRGLVVEGLARAGWCARRRGRRARPPRAICIASFGRRRTGRRRSSARNAWPSCACRARRRRPCRSRPRRAGAGSCARRWRRFWPDRARWRRGGPRACGRARAPDRGCGRRSAARRESRAR